MAGLNAAILDQDPNALVSRDADPATELLVGGNPSTTATTSTSLGLTQPLSEKKESGLKKPGFLTGVESKEVNLKVSDKAAPLSPVKRQVDAKPLSFLDQIKQGKELKPAPESGPSSVEKGRGGMLDQIQSGVELKPASKNNSTNGVPNKPLSMLDEIKQKKQLKPVEQNSSNSKGKEPLPGGGKLSMLDEIKQKRQLKHVEVSGNSEKTHKPESSLSNEIISIMDRRKYLMTDYSDDDSDESDWDD